MLLGSRALNVTRLKPSFSYSCHKLERLCPYGSSKQCRGRHRISAQQTATTEAPSALLIEPWTGSAEQQQVGIQCMRVSAPAKGSSAPGCCSRQCTVPALQRHSGQCCRPKQLLRRRLQSYRGGCRLALMGKAMRRHRSGFCGIGSWMLGRLSRSSRTCCAGGRSSSKVVMAPSSAVTCVTPSATGCSTLTACNVLPLRCTSAL